MSPSSFMAIVPALCALLMVPEATAFVGSHAFMRPSVAARSTAGASFKMSEGAEEVPTGPTALDISKGIAHPEAVFTVPENILKVLPHRYPFALVDKVLHFEAGKRIVGIKCITNNEPQFTGHFPDLPIMPGVLQVPCRLACTELPSNAFPFARFVLRQPTNYLLQQLSALHRVNTSYWAYCQYTASILGAGPVY